MAATGEPPAEVEAGVAALGSPPGGGGGAPPGGRRRRNPGGREKVIKVRVTVDEHDRLAELAAAARVSIPRLLYEAATAPEGQSAAVERAKYAALLSARRQLAGCANNLNQLAKWANTERAWPPDATSVIEDVAAATSRLDELLDA